MNLTPMTRCGNEIELVINSIVSTVQSWQESMRTFCAGANTKLAYQRIDDVVAQLVVPELMSAESLISGAGFVATPGFLADRHWHLAWWLKTLQNSDPEEIPQIHQLSTVDDPLSTDFRDYTRLEWWRVPSTTFTPHITGPYVDYLCTEEYALTFTAPVLLHTQDYPLDTFTQPPVQLVGMVGSDIQLAQLEKRLLPSLNLVGNSVFLINNHGRVLLSSDSQFGTGELLQDSALSDYLAMSMVTPSQGGALKLNSTTQVLPCHGNSLFIVSYSNF